MVTYNYNNIPIQKLLNCVWMVVRCVCVCVCVCVCARVARVCYAPVLCMFVERSVRAGSVMCVNAL